MLSRSDRLLVEHVAAQQGFELVVPAEAGVLTVGSSLVPGTISIRRDDADYLLIGVDLPLVAAALLQEFSTGNDQFVRAAEEGELYRIIGRAFQLCGSLPDSPLRTFELETNGLPKTTEADRLVVQRIGQDIFRKALESYWDRGCPITGVKDAALLRASHIIPWSESTEAQRLDVYNGLLLVAHLDAAFDKHLMTILPSGAVMFSSRLSGPALAILNPGSGALHVQIARGHAPYLERHQTRFAELESA
ncbi:HNH endonuclease [Rhizobium leguminosarum]|uniref:HNH endonuclease n=1 Tax=Rhizobium TaxID=379 RepID=UPI0010325F71|nr:HNH endonuclease signature motif containing protein [Rhizobium leguminosarum]TAV40644.1 HNH endonuclease [Rhizobium leguminosarum]TAV41212.1 HNH endonuclease [Rhizobium leguminosarum]TAV61077.1 HNH endonuclease [Rhizobium leguminosarum]TAY60375.1 HNH endonuclease [Rhizobium leguminosarum]